jgi:peroxiredoxin
MNRWILTAALLLAACAHAPPPKPSDSPIVASDGSSAVFRDYLTRTPWTVLVFISTDCPCVTMHDARLKELSHAYKARGVQFLAVDSEVNTTADSARRMATERAYPFPVLVDRGAVLANTYGAEYATFTVILDRGGNVRYRGGIDSDRHQLHDDAHFYVRDALDDLVAGRNPRTPEAHTLGCVLRKW